MNITAGGATPLHIAADNGSPEIINSLLKAGADPNVTDEVRGSVSLFFGTSLFVCRKKTCFRLGICHFQCWLISAEVAVHGVFYSTGPLVLYIYNGYYLFGFDWPTLPGNLYLYSLSVSTFSFLTITVTFTALSVL